MQENQASNLELMVRLQEKLEESQKRVVVLERISHDALGVILELKHENKALKAKVEEYERQNNAA